MSNLILFMCQRKNRSITIPVPMRCSRCRIYRDNAPVIVFTYCVTKFFRGSTGDHGSRTDQPGLIVDLEGTSSIDDILACLEKIVIPLNSCTTFFSTQGVVMSNISTISTMKQKLVYVIPSVATKPLRTVLVSLAL